MVLPVPGLVSLLNTLSGIISQPITVPIEDGVVLPFPLPPEDIVIPFTLAVWPEKLPFTSTAAIV